MKFIVTGTAEFTLSCIKALLENQKQICAIVSLPKHALPLNSVNLEEVARLHGIPYHEFEDINAKEAIQTLKAYEPDVIFAFWTKIIKKEVLDIPSKFCIGSHPTVLPYNRGRHPLHWLITLGIPETKLSFFVMDEGIDSGAILVQVPFSIQTEDMIEDVIKKMNAAAYEAIEKICDFLDEEPYYKGLEQDHIIANYWRKRSPYDVTLDLRTSADFILRTVRSYSHPYPCANLIIKQHILKVSHASIINLNISKEEFLRMEHGKIISIEDKYIRVKADDHIVELECTIEIPSNLLKTKYIHPPLKYLGDYPELAIKLKML